MEKEQNMINFLIKNGFSLLNQHENNYCVEIEYIDKIIEIAKQNEMIILGGDLYILMDNTFVNTKDNWYYEPNSFTKEEIDKSIEKLNTFINSFDKDQNYYISFVFWPSLFFNF